MSSIAVQAQTTAGKDFWLTFGDNVGSLSDNAELNLEIRVVATMPANITITFTDLAGTADHKVTPPLLAAGEVYTLSLGLAQKEAAYLSHYFASGPSSKSVRIQSDFPVTVYALNLRNNTADATNVLPVDALGTEYYHISYNSQTIYKDGYNIIATEDGTLIFDDSGSQLNTTPLNAGQVLPFYSGYYEDMTGTHITSNKPVAYFTTNGGSMIPFPEEPEVYHAKTIDNLYQQMLPVHTWGKNFCIPVTKRGAERIRIVASQDDTHITHQGGVIKTYAGTGSLTLNKGQFLEMEVNADVKNDVSPGGCFITADKPVGICSFMVTRVYYIDVLNNAGDGDPAVAWVSPVEQFVTEATVAPFITPIGISVLLHEHYALLIMPTDGREQTTVSIGRATPALVTGGTWTTCANPAYSFYNFEMTANESYTFSNPKGLTLLGYGIGNMESYYYLAASAARNIAMAFYVNDEHYISINGKKYCGVKNFHIKATIEAASADPGHLTWFIDGLERTDVEDQPEWDLTFQTPGEHTIRMVVTDLNNIKKTFETTIKTCPLRIPVNHRYRN
jgi:hypothetical protein